MNIARSAAVAVVVIGTVVTGAASACTDKAPKHGSENAGDAGPGLDVPECAALHEVVVRITSCEKLSTMGRGRAAAAWKNAVADPQAAPARCKAALPTFQQIAGLSGC